MARKRASRIDTGRLGHFVGAFLVFGALYLAWTYYHAHVVTPWHAAGDRAGKNVAEEHYAVDVLNAARKALAGLRGKIGG